MTNSANSKQRTCQRQQGGVMLTPLKAPKPSHARAVLPMLVHVDMLRQEKASHHEVGTEARGMAGRISVITRQRKHSSEFHGRFSCRIYSC